MFISRIKDQILQLSQGFNQHNFTAQLFIVNLTLHVCHKNIVGELQRNL